MKLVVGLRGVDGSLGVVFIRLFIVLKSKRLRRLVFLGEEFCIGNLLRLLLGIEWFLD